MTQETTPEEKQEGQTFDERRAQVDAALSGRQPTQQGAPAEKPVEQVTDDGLNEEKLDQILARTAKSRAIRSREKQFEAEKQRAVDEARAKWEAELKTRDPLDIYGDDEDRLQEVATNITAHSLGKDAPAELQEKQRQLQYDRNNKTLKSEIEALREEIKQGQNQRDLAEYQSKLTGYIEAKPADSPILNQLYSEFPEEFGGMQLLENAKALSVELDRIPKETEVVQYMEAKLEQLWNVMAKAKGVSSDPPEEKQPTSLTSSTLTGPKAVTPDEDFEERRKRVDEMLRGGKYSWGK